jgi:hypothetical protein
MTTYEAGYSDAIERTPRTSEAPDYRLGYLDGLHDRTGTKMSGYRDRTVGGLLFEASLQGDSASWSVTEPSGAIHSGVAIDIEHAIAACEGVARSLNQPSARMSQITASIRQSKPTLDEREVARLANRAVDYIFAFERHGTAGN